MQVLFSDPTYDHEDSYPPQQFAEDLRIEASAIPVEYSLEERDFGHGADWPMFLMVFAAVFAAGKTINDNIDGWIGIASKLRKLCNWLTSKCGCQWVDEEASALLALHAVIDVHQKHVSSIELVFSAFVPLVEVRLPSGESPDFQPVCVYFHVYKINSTTSYAVVVRSTGVVETTLDVSRRNPFVI